MATKKDPSLKEQVQRHNWILEEKVLPSLKKIEGKLEKYEGGMQLATLLNSKIIATVLGGIVAAGIYAVARTGGF